MAQYKALSQLKVGQRRGTIYRLLNNLFELKGEPKGSWEKIVYGMYVLGGQMGNVELRKWAGHRDHRFTVLSTQSDQK